MIEKLRIAVVVSKKDNGFPVGTILFNDGESLRDCIFFASIDLTGDRWKFQCYGDVISTVIDTRSAKGDDTLGAFLEMVWHYRFEDSESTLDWPPEKCRTDSAYCALLSLYEHGPDDSITIKINDADCTISRVSAKEILKALEKELG